MDVLRRSESRGIPRGAPARSRDVGASAGLGALEGPHPHRRAGRDDRTGGGTVTTDHRRGAGRTSPYPPLNTDALLPHRSDKHRASGAEPSTTVMSWAATRAIGSRPLPASRRG